VTVAPPSVKFAEAGIRRIEAALSYSDPDAGLAFSDKLTFADARDVGSFEFDYVSALHKAFSCNATLVFDNGLVLEHDLGSLDADKVVLPAA
jgi:hypothetical protein